MAWTAAVVGQSEIEPESKARGRLAKAAVAVFGLALCAGMLIPIYTDEIGWRFQERAGFDGVDKLFNDLCGPNTLAVPPFFMMPVRWYSAFFNSAFADPFYVRLSGVFYALIWLAMVLVLIRRIAKNSADRINLTLVGVGLMAIGMMPFLMVWSRPEQPIVLAATGALLFTWTRGAGNEVETPAGAAWLRSLLVVALAIVAFSYHAKAAFLLPVFLACLFFASRGRASNLPRLVVGALLVGIALWSAHYWVHRLECPDDAILRAAGAKNSIGVELVGARSPGALLAALGKIIGNIQLTKYFGLIAPRPDPMSFWLLEDQVTPMQWHIWHKGGIVLWAASVLLALVTMGLRALTLWRERRLDRRLIYAATLLIAVFSWSATQAHRNVYECLFVLPLVMLSVVFTLPEPGFGRRILGATRWLAVILGVVAVVSPIAVMALYAPSVIQSTQQRGYLKDQPFSVPVYGYGSLKPDILGAARMCGIGDPKAARALMIDDVTYFTFMESKLPQHRLGVIGLWKGEIKDPMAYLRSRGSSGAILGCHQLPPELRRQAKSQGLFCCLQAP